MHETSAHYIFCQSDGIVTRRYLRQLGEVGLKGEIAADLFRAQKSSTRAKQYSRRYRDHAYRRKGECLSSLCFRLLSQNEISWGWKIDLGQSYAPWVLYVDLPQGQVSFHALERDQGPDYPGDWDGLHASESRILDFCDSCLWALVTS